MIESGYTRWDHVLFYVMLFGLFVLTIPFKKRVGRRSASAYIAFVIALYAEMLGFPLSIYIFAWLFDYQIEGRGGMWDILQRVLGEPVGPLLEPLFLLFSGVMMISAVYLIVVGWWKIHRAKGNLVTDGLYARVRHPQYFGFVFLTSGMLFQFVSPLTVLMWPILVFSYYRLAKEEEKEMEEKFGKEYLEYRGRVPRFLPLIGRGR
ncbi:MAG: isoprenylcysteine carboxylmethyltransferase family protein [Deltaproteobacteria bacterium]|nr:isoprenylcysteine carboxylmethyltransferase family protein [Deltaproteobacteria bacterium]